MNDTEMLNLIEHYAWSIKRIEGIWHITTSGEIAKNASLREAIHKAIEAQRKWSIG